MYFFTIVQISENSDFWRLCKGLFTTGVSVDIGIAMRIAAWKDYIDLDSIIQTKRHSWC